MAGTDITAPGPEINSYLAAVIIPHYNDTERLLRCLDSLATQELTEHQASLSNPYGIEILVVDNGSTQSLAAVKAAHSSVRFVTEATKGAAAARNRGVQETTAAWIFFVDADCIPDKTWLAQALSHARKSLPGVDLIGGRVDVFDETAPPRSGAQAFEAVFAFNNRYYVEEKGFSVTANLLTRRDVFLDVGPQIVGLSEDMDWCHRATALGYKLIYDDALRCAHPTRTDWDALERKWLRLTEESFGINGKTPTARLRWGVRALTMLPSIAVHAPKVIKSPMLSGSGDRLRALGTLARLRLWRAALMLRQACRGR